MSKAEPFINDVFAIDFVIHTTKEEFLSCQDFYSEAEYDATIKELEFQTDNPNWIIRRAAAHFGYGLDELKNDKDSLVRQEAEQYNVKLFNIQNNIRRKQALIQK